MKTSLIILATLLLQLSTARAEEGLIQVPAGAETVSSSSSNLFVLPVVPTGSKSEDYVSWIMSLFERQRQNFASTLTTRLTVKKLDLLSPEEVRKLTSYQYNMAAKTPALQCIHHKEAFGFKFLPTGEAVVNCFATKPGDKKGISHLVEYRVHYVYNPKDCASLDNAKAFFAKKENLNAVMAESYHNSACTLNVFVAPEEHPVAHVYSLSPDAIAKELDKRSSLRDYVSGTQTDSKKAKNDGKDADKTGTLFDTKLYDQKQNQDTQ